MAIGAGITITTGTIAGITVTGTTLIGIATIIITMDTTTMGIIERENHSLKPARRPASLRDQFTE